MVPCMGRCMHRGDVTSREGEAGRGQLRLQKGVCLWREDARRCEAHWKPQTCTFSWFPMSLRAASMRAEKGWSAATPSATKKVVGVTLSSCTSSRCLWCAGGANGRYAARGRCTSPRVYQSSRIHTSPREYTISHVRYGTNGTPEGWYVYADGASAVQVQHPPQPSVKPPCSLRLVRGM